MLYKATNTWILIYGKLYKLRKKAKTEKSSTNYYYYYYYYKPICTASTNNLDRE